MPIVSGPTQSMLPPRMEADEMLYWVKQLIPASFLRIYQTEEGIKPPIQRRGTATWRIRRCRNHHNMSEIRLARK